MRALLHEEREFKASEKGSKCVPGAPEEEARERLREQKVDDTFENRIELL